MEKEEHAIILDYLPNGYPLERKMMPLAQAIGEVNLTLLELVPRRGISLEIGEKVAADGLIIEAENLSINEAILTGESQPVPKSAKAA